MATTNIDDKIKTGCVVTLKSGGPNMVVQNIFESSDGHMSARCAWFDNDFKPMSERFVLASLNYVAEN